MTDRASFHWRGAAMALLTGFLSFFSFFADPEGEPSQIRWLLLVLGAMSLFYLLAALTAARTNSGVKLRDVLFWAAIFRLLLLPSLPILETDYYRYLWDGYVLTKGVNPYRYSPAQIIRAVESDPSIPQDDPKLRRIVDETRKYDKARAVLEEVNNPDLHTIYPPFAQILFGVSSLMAPLSIYGWRFVVLFFDFALIAALILLLRRLAMPPVFVAYYAWSPLVLKEYINTLHCDGIALSGLFLGILFSLASYPRRSAAAFASAGLMKIFPALLLPFWTKKWPWKAWLIWIGTTAILIFPFFGVVGHSLKSAAAFANYWESNSGLVAGLEWTLSRLGLPEWGTGRRLFSIAGVDCAFDAFFVAKAILLGCFFGLFIFLMYRFIREKEASTERRMRWTFQLVGAMILCSPVCNPWYIAWCVPFLCFYPSAAWIYLSLSSFVYYSYFLSDPWGFPAWSRALEYGPFFLLWLWEAWRKKQ
ncbi:MAG: glycosyltransferase 87 family protein [Candidatus Omnitrophota bacterium]